MEIPKGGRRPGGGGMAVDIKGPSGGKRWGGLSLTRQPRGGAIVEKGGEVE